MPQAPGPVPFKTFSNPRSQTRLLLVLRLRPLGAVVAFAGAAFAAIAATWVIRVVWALAAGALLEAAALLKALALWALKTLTLKAWSPAGLALEAGALPGEALSSAEARSAARAATESWAATNSWATESWHALHHFFCEGLEFVAVEFLVAVFVEGEGSLDEAIR